MEATWRARRALAGLACALLAIHLISGAATAAVPRATAEVATWPARFSAGNAAGYRASWTYEDGSALAKLFLVVKTSGASGVAYLAVTRNGAAVAACTTTLPISCSFGKQRQGDEIDVVLGLTPASGASSVSADFLWSSSGATGSDGGTSHGDSWRDPDGAAVATFNPDSNYGGGFNVLAGGFVSNSQTLTATNKQSARLQDLPGTVAATVLDGPGVTFPCSDMAAASASGALDPLGHGGSGGSTPGGFTCSSLFGEWVEVHVGDGQAFGAPFQLIIKYASGTPKGFLHVLDGGGQELVAACPATNPASGAPCFIWNAGTKTATIYLIENGGMKGFN